MKKNIWRVCAGVVIFFAIQTTITLINKGTPCPWRSVETADKFPAKPMFANYGKAYAAPTLARKYGTSCLTCHSMTPRLNSFGEAVMLNGFRWPEADPKLRIEKNEEMMKEKPLVLGAQAYEKLWPKSVWPSTIPGTVPLAIRSVAGFKSIFGEGDAPFDEVDGELELFMLGAMGNNISAFGHLNAETQIKPFQEVQDKETVKIKVMSGWLAFENLGKHWLPDEDWLNLRVGMIGVDWNDMPHYRSHSTYRIDSTKAFYLNQIPYPDGFLEKNKYSLRRGMGAEFYGFTPRFNYNASYNVGIQEGGGTDLNVGHLMMSYKIGGMDNYGRTEQQYTHGHQEKAIEVGLISSLGQAKVQETAATARRTDRFWRVGGDTRLRWKDATLHAGALFGRHNNPYGTLDAGNVTAVSWFVAPEYYWFPWLMTGLRYEEEDLRIPTGVGLGDQKRARLHPYIGALVRANVRLTLEGNIFTNKSHNAAGNQLDHDDVGFLFDFTW